MQRFRNFISSKNTYQQLDLFKDANQPKKPISANFKNNIFIASLIASFFLGITIPLALASRELTPRIKFLKSIPKNTSFSVKLEGNTSALEKITGLSQSTINNLRLQFNYNSPTSSLLKHNGQTILATKRNNQGLFLSIDRNFWELSPSLKKWSSENLEGKDVDPKVKGLFLEQWLNIGYIPDKNISVRDFINTKEGVDFTTNLITLEYISNSIAVEQFLATITKSKVNFDPETVFIVHATIKDKKLSNMLLSLAPLGLGDLNMLIQPTKKYSEIWSERSVRTISKEYSTQSTSSKTIDAALTAILTNAQDIAIIKNSPLNSQILLQSYLEIAKDIDKSYTLSQSGGIVISNKSDCRELIIIDEKPLITNC